MDSNFKNVILIVVFNYSNCINNKDFIKKLYSKHFKKIIFYTDLPNNNDNEVNYLPLNRGIYGLKFLTHLKENYQDLINDSDGIFYTMDDNIININVLNNLDKEKIIYRFDNPTFLPLNELNGWWWDGEFGKPKLNSLQLDDEFKKYNINGYTGSFSDYFYIPKKYLNDDVYNLFYLFNKHEVFLEIALPTIIYYIEPNYDLYNKYDIILDRQTTTIKEHIFSYLKQNNILFIHPIKFNQIPESKNWLTEIFTLEN